MSRQEIGTDLYLFKAGIGYNEHLVISAHGGYEGKKGEFDVEHTTLHFYVDHGDLQSDFGAYRFRHAPPVRQTIMEGADCYNYSLSKYQGSHAGAKGKPAETYESIGNVLEAVEEEVMKMSKNAEKSPAYQKMIDSGVKVMPTQFDVLTVRNRWGSGDQMLKDVLLKVHNVHHYAHIHCFFCRGIM
jgi:hypothetical protein